MLSDIIMRNLRNKVKQIIMASQRNVKSDIVNTVNYASLTDL